MSISVEHVGLDFLMLADRAEFLNGKLYMMGGLYDRVEVKDLNNPPVINIVVGIVIPWALANQEHSVVLRVETEDGELLGKEIIGRVTVARPLNALPGQVFKAVMALNIRTKFPSYGAYRISAIGPGGDAKSTALYVLKSLQPQGQLLR